jgi:hypothetical protein
LFEDASKSLPLLLLSGTFTVRAIRERAQHFVPIVSLGCEPCSIPRKIGLRRLEP